MQPKAGKRRHKTYRSVGGREGGRAGKEDAPFRKKLAGVVVHHVPPVRQQYFHAV